MKKPYAPALSITAALASGAAAAQSGTMMNGGDWGGGWMGGHGGFWMPVLLVVGVVVCVGFVAWLVIAKRK